MKVITKSKNLKPGLHYLTRGGGWFRPEAAGYTDDIAQAGQFSADEALSFMKAEGVHAVPVGSMREEIWAEVGKALGRAAKLAELVQRL